MASMRMPATSSTATGLCTSRESPFPWQPSSGTPGFRLTSFNRLLLQSAPALEGADGLSVCFGAFVRSPQSTASRPIRSVRVPRLLGLALRKPSHMFACKNKSNVLVLAVVVAAVTPAAARADVAAVSSSTDPAVNSDPTPSELQGVVISAQRLDIARAGIETQTGASTYTINAEAIKAAPGGDN